MVGVKKIWAVAVLLLFAGCSLHGGGVGHNTSTKIKLSGNNFNVIGSVSGMAKAEYIFGIGPSEEKLFGEAYKNMIGKSDLKYKSKIVINVTTDVKQTSLLLWSEKKIYLSGEVIEFTARSIDKLAKTDKDKLLEIDKLKKASAEDRAKYEQALADLEKARKDAKIAAQVVAKAQKKRFMAEEDKNKALTDMEGAIQERDSALRERDACIAERDKALKLGGKVALKLSKLGNVKREKRGLVVQLSDILFEFARSSLTTGSKTKLKEIVKVLQGITGRKFVVEGHTDTSGDPKFNKLLSEKRANSVMKFLLASGINKAQISAKGFGMERPTASNKTSAGRKKNRRVNIVILDNSSP